MKKEGLTSAKAKELLLRDGLNELPEKRRSSVAKLFISQIKNLMALLLLVASVLAFLVGDKLDGVLILLILILNAALGFWQEYKASKELEALRKLEVASSRVIRDGRQIEISSKEIVVGDLVILESGDKIPADGLIVESSQMLVNESSLTGESLPSLKSNLEGDNQVYFGTVVVSGKGLVEVTQVGANTKFGKISLELANIQEEQTPLEISLASLGKRIGLMVIAIAILTFLIRVFQGFNLIEVFFVSIALMVAAVPEGLPTIITIALALGVRRMYQKKTLVRKLSSIESLGATTVICSDKTGTLTKNEMSVRKVMTKNPSALDELIKVAVICNNSSLVLKEDSGSFDILGDTTEGALLLWAESLGQKVDLIREEGKTVEEIPFDAKRRMMSVVWQEDKKLTLFCKGAPEVILERSDLDGKVLDENIRQYKELAGKGLRVLAFAKKNLKEIEDLETEDEKNLEFLGLIAIADVPRTEAKQTIQKAREAGVKIVMITGDSELTAKAIAEEVGLLEEGDELLTGSQLDNLSDNELVERLPKVRVFARTLPEQKLRIIQSFQKMGEVVAVTGDGVNDALALKQAEVGVAMGNVGTDVAKEASDIIILDDNLSTIVTAIEQGRLVYSNIVKVVKFLLTGNLSEVLVITVAIILGFPTPLLAVQILWINFVTDGLPALALIADTASSKIMTTPPRSKSQSILNKETIKFILGFGSLISLVVLGVFFAMLQIFPLEVARSYVFTTMVICQMALIFAMRRHHTVLSNSYLFFSVFLVLVLQALILYHPIFQKIFRVYPGF
ncbi:calcium-translocating P-type ATPase, PMCA-type [Candidatus Daviesbacteria bacterium]|nr:calcium-translocating P-type ATPase, PMCA-type [Candidatus Daviesbacteria bacterium]